jgi:hypothetical protein
MMANFPQLSHDKKIPSGSLSSAHKLMATLIIVVCLLCAIAILSTYSQKSQIILSNEGVNYTLPFSLQPWEGALETKIEGTVFIFGEEGEQRGLLVGTFYIDPADSVGIGLYLPEGIKINSFEWDYRLRELDPQGEKNVLFGQFENGYGPTMLIIAGTFGKTHKTPSGGGPGALVIDFTFDKEKCTSEEGSTIFIGIGKDTDVGAYYGAEGSNHVLLDISMN